MSNFNPGWETRLPDRLGPLIHADGIWRQVQWRLFNPTHHVPEDALDDGRIFDPCDDLERPTAMAAANTGGR